MLAITGLRPNTRLEPNPTAAFRALVWGVAIVAMLSGSASQPVLAGQTPVNPQAASLKGFSDRVKQYLDLQKKLESQLPPLPKTTDAARIDTHIAALAEAIRNARKDPQPGDIFGDVAEQVRLIIRQDSKIRSTRDTKASMEEVPKATQPRVNAAYPSKSPLATVPPLILSRLPTLPEGLEYRFMERDLILRDVKSNLIVDYVQESVPVKPAAKPTTTPPATPPVKR